MSILLKAATAASFAETLSGEWTWFEALV